MFFRQADRPTNINGFNKIYCLAKHRPRLRLWVSQKMIDSATVEYFFGTTIITFAFVALGWCFMWHAVLKRNPAIQAIFLKGNKSE